MKYLKISFVVVGIAIITFLSIYWWDGTKPLQVIPTAENQFTKDIQNKIDSIDKLPNSVFCPSVYNEILLQIVEDYKPHPQQYPYGRLDSTQSGNDQQKDNLTRSLYSAYSNKFILQAFHVFQGTNWRDEDLNFIKKETQVLQNYDFLKKGDPKDRKFYEILSILNKYYEIIRFISSCNTFSYQASSFADRFPISDVRTNITQAAFYQSHNLENQYVNNCLNLHTDLIAVPKVLFNTHIRYLDNKIDQFSGKYSDPQYQNNQPEYVRVINKPLKDEIEQLNNNLYNVPNFIPESTRVAKRWSDENVKAFKQ